MTATNGTERLKANHPSKSMGALQLWRDAFAALGDDRIRMVLTGVMALVSGLLETALLYLISRIAITVTGESDEIVLGGMGPIPERLVPISVAVALAIGLVVTQVALSVPIARSLASLSARTLVRTRTRLIRAQLGASWRFRANNREGHFAQMIGEYSQRSEQLVNQLGIVFVSGCQIVMLLVGAVIVAPLATLVAAVALAVLAVAVGPFARGVKSGSLKNSGRNRLVVSDAQQLDRLAAEVTTFEVGDAVAARLEGEIQRASRDLSQIRFRGRLTPILYQYGALTVVLAMIGVVTLVGVGNLSGITALILILIRALTYVRQFLSAMQSGSELTPYWEALQSETARLSEHPMTSGSVEVDSFSSLTFDHVSFAYNEDRLVLDDVSFAIGQNDAVGFVGPSGGGKTTTLGLMLRLLEPTSGRITFNGIDLHEVDRASWAKAVAFVPQENKLISGTIAENIEFFRPGFTREQVMEAAAKAHVHDEIVALPGGYDTLVGPGSQALSGGQCQRVGIARALLGAPSLILLDEPTSALDARSEELIRQSLTELAGTTTLVLIAHRPATLELCNRILTVRGGSITENPSPSLAR